MKHQQLILRSFQLTKSKLCKSKNLRDKYSFSTSSNNLKIIDLRSDTITKPTPEMLQSAISAPLGDDVYDEDPTVHALQDYAADLFGKHAALFVPTGTMSNLCAILSHCHERASEIIIGSNSHLAIYEGGNVSNMGGVSTRQLEEDSNGRFQLSKIQDLIRLDNDDHYAKTQVICLENTHNTLGGISLPKSYIDEVGRFAKSRNLKVHVDGARIFNAATAQNTPVKSLNEHADSVSVCLSKGLGAPLGSVLVGDTEFIRLAKRVRKRAGGGMRQVGVVAAMGLHALQHHVERIQDDHDRAKRLAKELQRFGFYIPREGAVDSNLVFFGLPEESLVNLDNFSEELQKQFGVKIYGGYSEGGRLFRAAMHLDVSNEDVDKAAEAIINLCCSLK